MDTFDQINLTITTILSVTFIFSIVFVFYLHVKRRSSSIVQEKEYRESIKNLELSSTSDIGTVEFIINTLEASVKRENITMLSSDRRSDVLFLIGTSLMVLSVLAPLASLFIYLQYDVVHVVNELKEAGLWTDASTITPSPDWRLLFSGISFGFLFLAAASGILKQEGKQREKYFTLSKRVTDFRNMISALNITNHDGEDEIDKNGSDVIDRIVGLLLTPQAIGPAQNNSSDSSESVTPEQVKMVNEFLKLAKSESK